MFPAALSLWDVGHLLSWEQPQTLDVGSRGASSDWNQFRMDPKAGVLENCLLDHLEQGNSGFGYQTGNQLVWGSWEGRALSAATTAMI